MLQFVRENAYEALIIRWLPAEVRRPLLSYEEDGLHRSPAAVCLDPAFASFVQRASPESHPIRPQGRVGHFKDDAAAHKPLLLFVCFTGWAQIRAMDRLFWVGLSRVWKGWRSPLLYVQADTVVRW